MSLIFQISSPSLVLSTPVSPALPTSSPTTPPSILLITTLQPHQLLSAPRTPQAWSLLLPEIPKRRPPHYPEHPSMVPSDVPSVWNVLAIVLTTVFCCKKELRSHFHNRPFHLTPPIRSHPAQSILYRTLVLSSYHLKSSTIFLFIKCFLVFLSVFPIRIKILFVLVTRAFPRQRTVPGTE